MKRDALFLLGAVLVVAGIAVMHWPTAMIVAGLGALHVAKQMGTTNQGKPDAR